MNWLVANALMKLPFVSDMLSWLGGGPASKEYMISSMARNENIGFLPGGFEEATLFENGKHVVYIQNRKGFMKYALQHGYKVYPVYTFGEEMTYTTIKFASNEFRLWLNKHHIPAVLFCGYWWCFFLPIAKVDLTTVIGEPMVLPTIKEPSMEQVEEYHAAYVTALTALFERNKEKYAYDKEAVLFLY